MKKFPKTKQDAEKANWPCWSCRFSDTMFAFDNSPCRFCYKASSQSRPSRYVLKKLGVE